jgi:hypothetical protein
MILFESVSWHTVPGRFVTTRRIIASKRTDCVHHVVIENHALVDVDIDGVSHRFRWRRWKRVLGGRRRWERILGGRRKR